MQSDIVILGAGPGGCAAAITALQHGLSVRILQSKSSPKSLPGETLHPAVEPIFQQLGVLTNVLKLRCHRHRGIWREDEKGNRIFHAYGQNGRNSWMGFQMDRCKLNEILRKRIAELGGEITSVAHLDDIVLEKAIVRGVRADDNLYFGQLVFDATGRRSWLAEKLRLTPEQLTPNQKVRFGWSARTPPDLDGEPLFQSHADGWDWFAPLGDGRCAWVKLRHNQTARGIDCAWRIFRHCAGEGYFLIGDSACSFDPSAANGVLRALMSGIYAVHLINAARFRRLPLKTATAAYRTWFGKIADRTFVAYHRKSV